MLHPSLLVVPSHLRLTLFNKKSEILPLSLFTVSKAA